MRSAGEEEHTPPQSALVTIQAGSKSTLPLFCIHAEAGDVSLYHGLARHLAPERTMLGLCAPAPGELDAHARLEQLAERHVRVIRRAQPDGPYLIVGECTGGALAYEIAQQLRAAGQEVPLLALIDAFAPGQPRLASWMPKPVYRIIHRVRILGFHAENLIRLGMRAKFAYVIAKAQRAGRALRAKLSARRRRATGARSPQLAFREALAAYEPAPYAGSVVLFRAARMPLGSQAAPDMGWAALVQDVDVETIPGYFTTPISEPEVRTIADRLARYVGQYRP